MQVAPCPTVYDDITRLVSFFGRSNPTTPNQTINRSASQALWNFDSLPRKFQPQSRINQQLFTLPMVEDRRCWFLDVAWRVSLSNFINYRQEPILNHYQPLLNTVMFSKPSFNHHSCPWFNHQKPSWTTHRAATGHELINFGVAQHALPGLARRTGGAGRFAAGSIQVR